MYQIESKTNATELIQLLEDKIYEHNAQAIEQDDGHLFSKIIRNEKGDVVAGIGGWIWARACEVTQLWVDKKMRGNGIGKMLLDAAELEATSKGCVSVLIKTYSFQAPGFYMQNGYGIEHQLDSFPQGHTYYTLVKRIG